MAAFDTHSRIDSAVVTNDDGDEVAIYEYEAFGNQYMVKHKGHSAGR